MRIFSSALFVVFLIVHKTGHGLGIDVYEGPQIMSGNDQELAEGMRLAIEPGVYHPVRLVVRIEDNVVSTKGDSRSLTGFERNLTIVGYRQTNGRIANPL